VDDAWEFVKFMNSEDAAKFKSRSTYELSSRNAFVKPREGMSYNIDAFTKMKPAPVPNGSPADQRLLQERPNLSLIQDVFSQVYNSIFQGQRTVDEALELMDTKGNDLLQKIKTNPKGQIDGVYDDLNVGGGMSIDKMNVMRAAGAIQ